eukprot:766991-Hanusia_phi.AAC.9
MPYVEPPVSGLKGICRDSPSCNSKIGGEQYSSEGRERRYVRGKGNLHRLDKLFCFDGAPAAPSPSGAIVCEQQIN